MASLIQRLAVLAKQTFGRLRVNNVSQEHFTQLKALIAQATKYDVCLDPSLVADESLFTVSGGKTPVTYVHIWEDDAFSVGIFILKNGARLPLHDHPGMYGLCKVIHGKASIRSYSLTEAGDSDLPLEIEKKLSKWQKQLMKAVNVHQNTVLDSSCAPCVLTPTEGNYHEIAAVNGPAAFLDILAPPYDHNGGRECHYYSELLMPRRDPAASDTVTVTDKPQVKWLIEIPQPHDFWCDSAEYIGPQISFTNDESTSV